MEGGTTQAIFLDCHWKSREILVGIKIICLYCNSYKVTSLCFKSTKEVFYIKLPLHYPKDNSHYIWSKVRLLIRRTSHVCHFWMCLAELCWIIPGNHHRFIQPCQKKKANHLITVLSSHFQSVYCMTIFSR